MKKQKRKKKRFGGSEFLILLIFLAGLGILTYPTISDLWNRYRNAQLITEYSQSVSSISNEEYDRILANARKFNREHTVNNIVDAFDENEDYVLTHPYDTYLNPQGDGIMGYISIPEIDAELAIYHGTGEDVLEKGVGHVEGTSLPVGGESTHAVLSAHRGLPSAKLFTDLDQLKKGDLFYLHILDETLAYRVDRILTVLPDETEALAIEQEKDYITLLTCTPYGVNTHRLLVRGVRTAYLAQTDGGKVFPIDTVVKDHRVALLVAGLSVFLLFLIWMLLGDRKRRKTDNTERNGGE